MCKNKQEKTYFEDENVGDAAKEIGIIVSLTISYISLQERAVWSKYKSKCMLKNKHAYLCLFPYAR